MRPRYLIPAMALTASLSACGSSTSTQAAAKSSSVRESHIAVVAQENASARQNTGTSSPPRTTPGRAPVVALIDSAGNPIIPAAAKAHTDAGAIAFTKYYWALLDDLDARPQLGVVKRLAAQGCGVCSKQENGYADNKQHQIVVKPAQSLLTNIRVTQRNTSTQVVAVQFDMKHVASQEWREGKRAKRNPEVRFSSVVLLKWVSGQGWRVLDIGLDQK